MFVRRRPLLRAAVVGGTAYYAGKKIQQGRQREADQNAEIADLQQQQAQQAQTASAPAPASAPAAVGESVADQLTKLKSLLDTGALSQQEFDAAKQKILQGG
jgi:membrane protease subunit (stomatin/prohibitin family)